MEDREMTSDDNIQYHDEGFYCKGCDNRIYMVYDKKYCWYCKDRKAELTIKQKEALDKVRSALGNGIPARSFGDKFPWS